MDSETNTNSDMTKEERQMIELSKLAVLELVTNEIIECKRREYTYEQWLYEFMKEDYKNEFETKCRKNKNWHSMWDNLSKVCRINNVYTYKKGYRYEIDISRVDCHRSKYSVHWATIGVLVSAVAVFYLR